MIRMNVPAPWALATLDSAPLNTGFIRTVLDGTSDGALWVDRAEAPRVLHAMHTYGMSLIWGDAVADGFEPVIGHLRTGAYRTIVDEWLQIDPRWQDLNWDQRLGAVPSALAVESDPCRRHTRLNFRFEMEAFRQLDAKRAAPDGWHFRLATPDDFDLPGQVVPRWFWRDARRFLAAGGGWCAEQDGQVGAIAFVSYRWGDEFEIGIETFPHARRQGLGRAVAACLISDILQANLRPVWSCRLENTASCQLAGALGFRQDRAIPYYHLKPIVPLSTGIGSDGRR